MLNKWHWERAFFLQNETSPLEDAIHFSVNAAHFIIKLMVNASKNYILNVFASQQCSWLVMLQQRRCKVRKSLEWCCGFLSNAFNEVCSACSHPLDRSLVTSLGFMLFILRVHLLCRYFACKYWLHSAVAPHITLRRRNIVHCLIC